MITVTPKQLIRILKLLIPQCRPVWIHGQPGIGKSDIVRHACQLISYLCPHFPPAVCLDPVDTRGCPDIDKGSKTTYWCPPDFWPRGDEWKGVLFLDELPMAADAVGKALLQLIQGRRLGSYVLPKFTSFVVCGNRPQDRAGVGRIISPLANRFCHLELACSSEDWLGWAAVNGLDPLVRAFIKMRPELLNTFDPNVPQLAYGTPRTWHELAKQLPALLLEQADIWRPVVQGEVGDGPGVEFTKFLEIKHRCPDPEDCVNRPTKAPVPDEPSLRWATCAAVVDLTRNCAPERLDNACVYLARMPTDYTIWSIQDMIDIDIAHNRPIRVTSAPAGIKILRDNASVLVGKGLK